MNSKVIITCALTGAGATVGKSEHVPVTPEQIAASGIEAAKAGAAIVHVHVRDPQTGDGTREVALYREVVERLRDSGVDVVINTTAGMWGDLYLNPEDPSGFAEGTDLVSGIARLAHVEELLPDICTLDCGSLNFGEGSLVYVSTPDMLRAGAKRIQELGVRPELEIFDTGHLWFANQLVEEGLIDAPAMYQLCMGIPYGAPPNTALLAAVAAQMFHATARTTTTASTIRWLGDLGPTTLAVMHGASFQGDGKAALHSLADAYESMVQEASA